MMPDHFIDDEAKKLLGEIGIELGVLSEFAEAIDLPLLAVRIGGGKAMLGFVPANRLRHLEPFGKHEHQRSIDIVDAVAIVVQLRIGHAGLPRLHLP